jgi:predicted metal-dependent phosphotriesterase family hydrolase
MSKVNTVLGPVDSSALGRTRMHEHIIIEYPGTDQDPLLEFDKEGTAQAATEQLLALKARGSPLWWMPPPLPWAAMPSSW